MQNKMLVHIENTIRKPACHFDPPDDGGGSAGNQGCACGTPPRVRNDSKFYYGKNHTFRGASINIKVLLTIFLVISMLFFHPNEVCAQNIMKINNVQGFVSDTLVVSLSITNGEEFISFQCDILQPDGFSYLPGSISLSTRNVDHLVSATDIGNNVLRILSYSLNNTAFLSDSGTVASLLLTTPPTGGDYVIELKNGIIGNAESVNILDSLTPGTITLSPLGVLVRSFSESSIHCYPNPFSQILTVRLEIDSPLTVHLEVFDIKGILLSSRNLRLNQTGMNEFVFHAQDLLGNKPSDGVYLLNFRFQHENQKYSIIKRVKFLQW